jgi:Spx/MgsR family transcriptional regulator
MKTITVYGIPNCDSIKKAFDWFKSNSIEVKFHDYKKEGIKKQKLAEWCKIVGWEILLNKKSTTWRGLSKEQQNNITDKTTAIQLMQQNTSLIKRPVIEVGEQLLVGFNETIFNSTFK